MSPPLSTYSPDRAATVVQALSAAAAVAGSLLRPEAVQALLAGHGNAAAQEDGGAGGGPLGHTSGAGTMQELLLSLRAAAAAGGGDVQRMFGASCFIMLSRIQFTTRLQRFCRSLVMVRISDCDT